MSTTLRIMTFDIATKIYTSKDGWTLKREIDTKTPNGNTMGGRWALRNADGDLYEFGAYRNDIAEMHDLRLDHKEDEYGY